MENAQAHHPELAPLVDLVGSSPELLAVGDINIQHAALQAAKFVFDMAISLEPTAEKHITGLLESIQAATSSQAGPQTRSKTKAVQENTVTPAPVRPPLPPFALTPIDSLYLENMNPDQIWEQLELRTKNISQVLEAIVEESGGTEEEDSDSSENPGGSDDEMDLDMDGIDAFDDEDSDDDYEDEEDEGGDGDGDTRASQSDVDSDEAVPDLNKESIAPIRPGDDELYPELDLDRPRGTRLLRSGAKRPSHPTLDDEFFSIDDFNRQTEEMESLSRSRGHLSVDDDEDDNEPEDVDLFHPLDEAPEAFEEDDEDGNNLSSNPSYEDFFAPPRRPAKRRHQDSSADALHEGSSLKTTGGNGSKGVTFSGSVRVKTIEPRKVKSKGNAISKVREKLSLLFPSGDDDEDEDEEEVDWDMEKFVEDAGGPSKMWGGDAMDEDEGDDDEEEDEDDDEDEDEDDEGEGGSEDEDGHSFHGVETIQRLKDDLFDDNEDEGIDAGKALSAYQKRQAELAEQIKALEAENIGPKDWTVMGEATSRARPKNSLLEEDLDFERAAKAIPVITEASTKTLEDRIKARILENRFDDVVRKRPVDEKPFLPSRVFELQDTQSSRSLAQIYEDEYSAANADAQGVSRGDDRDGKLAKEHEEIDNLWGAICYKLDALSNAHFTPKQPKVAISTVSNVSTATLESALPTAVSTSTLLAPEEVHTPAAGDLRARSELTPKEKRAARTKARKARKKHQDALAGAVGKFGGRKVPKNVKEAKDAALKSLVKTGKGVTVVGKERRRPLGSRGTVGKSRSDTTGSGEGKNWKL